MAFANDLLSFLHANKDHFGYYFQCDNFPIENEVISSRFESTYIIRGGDDDHPDWFPDATTITQVDYKLDYDTPITVVVWARQTDNFQSIHDVYQALTCLPELSYATVRTHPNGLTSLDFCLSDVNKTANYQTIVDNIHKL